VPGRLKTDKLDAVWLAKVVERGMCAPSLCTPSRSGGCGISPGIGAALIRERTREKQRCEKLLDDAQIKLSA